MIVDVRLPRIRLPRLRRHPSLNWQRWFLPWPILGHIEGRTERVLLLPGWYETRVSASQYRRLWREPISEVTRPLDPPRANGSHDAPASIPLLDAGASTKFIAAGKPPVGSELTGGQFHSGGGDPT